MQMVEVRLKKSFHRGNAVVQLHFERHEILFKELRALKGMLWSKTMACWYVPYRAGLVKEVLALVRGLAWVDYSALSESGECMPKPLVQRPEAKTLTRPDRQLQEADADTTEKLNRFRNWMVSKRYSASTINTYSDALKTFLRFCIPKPVSDIDNEDLIRFNTEYIHKNRLSSSFQNQVVNAVKLFFQIVETRRLNPELIHRPRPEKPLPNVLSKEEIKLILSAHHNIKHRAMLSLIYSCGLRRGELLNLKVGDIDSKRGLVIIRQGKGKKDRVAPLSEKILELLRAYYAACKPRIWLFEGQKGQQPYDERSLQSVLKQALEKCKINKPVSLHWLRHSYATHLLENGTDLRYIQEILGHSRSRTTEIYTHVSNKSIQKIVSPFDTL